MFLLIKIFPMPELAFGLKLATSNGLFVKLSDLCKPILLPLSDIEAVDLELFIVSKL